MSQALLIRPADRSDAEAWQRMRNTLWPEGAAGHGANIARYFSTNRTRPAEVLIVCVGSGAPVGFVELSIRHYAEGKAGVVDGWYIEPACRNREAEAALMVAAEEWARTAGCTGIETSAQRHRHD